MEFYSTKLNILFPRKNMKQINIPNLLILTFLSIVLISIFMINIAEARPEFAAELDKDCTFCHIDPAGGGPRNRIGEIFEENYFEFPEDFDMEAVTEETKELIKQITT